MSTSSPTKSSQSRSVFSKHIRLNLNSKFIPQDFFPQSISQYCKTRKRNDKQIQCQLLKKNSYDDTFIQQNFLKQNSVRNIELLKKRLIKIKQSKNFQIELESNKKLPSQKGSRSKDLFVRTVNNQKSEQKNSDGEKGKAKGYSTKLMNYMQKMKKIINIDIKFQDDSVSPLLQRYSKDISKQNPQDVQTDDSPKTIRYRPKSQINERQRLMSKQKVKNQSNKIMYKPLRIKVKNSNEPSNEIAYQRIKYRNQRYNKFIDIPLDQDGMLTFYGSPDKKCRGSYDSRKYLARTSLPRLQK